jgi:H/ACA ribonucleoprotein complex subunit 4
MGKFSNEEIWRALNSFEGKIEQTPPRQSAVKKVRRIREIYALRLLEAKPLAKRTDILFRVNCQAGTYIRVLCEDVGKKLGARAFMVELRRTKVGAITEKEAITLHRLRALILAGGSNLEKFVKPIEHYIPSKVVVANDAAIANVNKGMALYPMGIISGAEKLAVGDYVRITSKSGEMVAIGKFDGKCVKLLRVFI